jgi:hypothetical protein
MMFNPTWMPLSTAQYALHDDILLTICDTTRNKNLIIDGLHRGRILCWDWNAINHTKNRKITIWHLRGGNMVEIFPIETINL